MEIDIRLLVDQEPEFRDYLMNVLTDGMLSTKESHDFIRAIYNFYCIGISKEQATEWLAKTIRDGERKRGDEDIPTWLRQ